MYHIFTRLGKYLITASSTEIAGSLQGHTVYRITGHNILPLKGFNVHEKAEDIYIKLLESHLNSASLFFSPTWDLTNSYQRQSGPTEQVWRVADERFFWNKYASQELIDAAQQDSRIGNFITSVIYGYAQFRQTTILNHPVCFGLITRRSTHRAGTRYFRRGVDEDGNVANFNETEQILLVPGGGDSNHQDTEMQVYSYIQTRGSVPVYWAEINNLKYAPKLTIGASPLESAKKHFDQQVSLYGKNYLVNLVNQSGREKAVKSAYEDLVHSLGSPELDYVYFDFHHECSKMRWHRAQLLIDELLIRGLKDQGWYSAKIGIEKGVVESLQKSVVRTNCMDCLDRTNVVQSQLGKWVLQRQLEDAGVVGQDQSWENDFSFEKIFRSMWADNADAVSTAYSGTGALKTDFTRLGKRTALGALMDLKNSVTRYFKNNFLDGPRQDAYDLFLGKHLPYETMDPPFHDSRPITYQIIPYVFWGSLVMAVATTAFPSEDTPSYANRMFQVLWAGLVVYSSRFVIKNGLQFVCWPKLVKLGYVRKVEIVKNGKTAGFIMEEAKPDNLESKHE